MPNWSLSDTVWWATCAAASPCTGDAHKDGLSWQHVIVLGGLTSQQQPGEPQGQICFDSCTCCHTEREAADQLAISSSGTDLFRQLYMLPHWGRSCRSNLLSHPQGQICLDNCTCCHAEIEAADQCYLTLSHFTETRPTSHSTDL